MRLLPATKTRELERLLTSLRDRCPRTHAHSRRVATHAAEIAREMGLGGAALAAIEAAALAHDLGKVETPRPIVEKPGPLTPAQYAVIKRHAEAGARMVASLGNETLRAIVAYHHERLDGSGYPDGLRGEEIPLGARIVAVADIFDALTSSRPYRRVMSPGQALEVIDAASGTQLDPHAVVALHRCLARRRAPMRRRERSRLESIVPVMAQLRRTRLGPSTAAPTRLASG